ncbi:hypothetical protein [Lactovum miscens]|uniref:Uncharacterized protein n=1 Tax=Lactovum miscens TaxID=190387 RepID=A0A841C5R4_9LACT|nr:hypothetical protein [Lactovum miscens]MBB5887617.1 hypothetical protein [Lactovum miscens]
MANKIQFQFTTNGLLMDSHGEIEFSLPKNGISYSKEMHRVKLYFLMNENLIQAWDYNESDDRIILKNGYEVGIGNELFDSAGNFIALTDKIHKSKKTKAVFTFSGLVNSFVRNPKVSTEENELSTETSNSQYQDELLYEQFLNSLGNLIDFYNRKQEKASVRLSHLNQTLLETEQNKNNLEDKIDSTIVELTQIKLALENKANQTASQPAIRALIKVEGGEL